MSDFVYEDGTLPTGKSDARALTVASNKGVTAAEFNTVTAALLSLRSALLDGTYHGFDAGGAVAAKVAMRQSIPTSGAWHLGDIVFDSTNPHSPSPAGWICTATGDFAGSPPTFALFSDAIVKHFTGGVVAGGNSLDSKAILQADSTTKGMLPPRMTRTQRDAIASPPAGLVVYNSTTARHEFYNGSTWQSRAILELQEAQDNTTDRTAHINAALALGGHVYIGPGTYMVANHLDMVSNTRLTLHPGAILKRSLSMPTSTQMIRMVGVGNIIIEGGTIDGAKLAGPSPGGGGQAAGITTSGCSDLVVRDMVIKNFPSDAGGGSYGYGVYLGGSSPATQSRLRFSNLYVFGCEQNNMFIVSGRDIVIENSNFVGATGDTPGSGLDIEPNSYFEEVHNLVVRNCVFSGNSSGVTCNNHYSGYWHDILFEGCSFRGNRNLGASFTGSNLPENNTRLINCIAVNNGAQGLYLAGLYGAQVSGCRIEGNHGHGVDLFAVRDFVMTRCQVHNNYGDGISMTNDTSSLSMGTVYANSFFNNGGSGFQLSLGGATGPACMEFAFNKTGNDATLCYPAWTASHLVHPDFRILKGGKIYECITEGFTASSGGPTGTSTDITDNEAHWKYIMDLPVQQWGFYVTGAASRGASFTRNHGFGNTVAEIFEQPSGDPSTTWSADFIGSQLDGDRGSPLTRARSVSFEDLSGTPGDVSTSYAAGIAAIAAATVYLNFDGQTGNFTNGLTITGGTSGAHGVLASNTDAGATGTLRMTGVVGTFVDNEAITDSGAGAAVVNGGPLAYMTIATPFARVGDGVTLTPRDIDATLDTVKAKVLSDNLIVVQGKGAATAAYSFFWEVVKKGAFPQ